MATAEAPRTKPTRAAERDPQVYHPLDRLRGIIRRYVVIEGLLLAVLFLAGWFTLGLALDYGVFKVSGWDWARDGSWWVRCIALVAAVVLFAALLVFRIVRRLTTEFSYPALALVLERKFPKVLGDRLITAVEMADVEAMGKFGYSKDMIRATIAEARERVAKVPVNEVFNWRRLWVLGFLAVGLLVATVAFSFASYAVATKSADVYRFGWKFAHVTGIFAERNVALMDTPWPRRAHIELVDFPESGELTVGRDAPPPRIAARAYRWVVADSNTPDGWRPLRWSDLSEKKLVDRKVPNLPPNMTFAGVSGSPYVDAVEHVAYASDEEARPDVVAVRAAVRDAMNAGGGQDFEELQEVFKELFKKADEPSMGRKLRRLELPGEVEYKFSGKKTAGGGSLGLQPNNEFAGEIGGLKEDVEFVVKAADYTSIPRRIRLIPPPMLKVISREQLEPAYLHHEPPLGEGYNALKGRFQKVTGKDLSLTGDRSVVVVSAGTELTLTAMADTDDGGGINDSDRIVSAFATPVAGRFPGTILDAKGLPTQQPVPLTLLDNGAGFKINFANGPKDPAAPQKPTDFRLVDNVDFKVTWTNKYNVSATRSFLIQVAQDAPPVVEVAVDTIRKQGNVYLVTPSARIPFNPESFIKDDHGLSKVEYVFNYYAEDSDIVRALRTKYALRSLLDVPLPGVGPARLLPQLHADNFRALDKSDDRLNGSVFVSDFINQQRGLPRRTRDEFERKLNEPKSDDAAPDTVKKVELKNPERDYFDLKELHDLGLLKIAVPRGEVQTIYRMDLNVQATDNNVDAATGPRVTRNAEPIRLRIVGEIELLDEINKEARLLGSRMEEAIARLAGARKKYEFVQSTNGFKDESPANVDAVKVRAQDALQDVEKARDIVQSVAREFHRLHRECQINRVVEATVKRYGTVICAQYDATLSEDLQAAVPTFSKTLASLNVVQNPLNSGRWAVQVTVTDAQKALYDLEAQVKDLRLLTGKNEGIDELRRQAAALLEKQRQIRKEIDDWRGGDVKIITAPYVTVRGAGVVSLGKGEAKRVTHTIVWGTGYEKETVDVKVTASDPSITVPAELKLDFEKNQFQFDYEVKAGTKEGTYKITLQPSSKGSPPVEVQVIVK